MSGTGPLHFDPILNACSQDNVDTKIKNNNQTKFVAEEKNKREKFEKRIWYQIKEYAKRVLVGKLKRWNKVKESKVK